MKSYPLTNKFVISPRAIYCWLHSSGWFQESDSAGSFYIEAYRSADEIQSIVEHLRKFQGPRIRIQDIKALLVPRVSVPDEPVSTEAPYFDELSILTKTPVDDIISALVSWEDRLRWEEKQAVHKSPMTPPFISPRALEEWLLSHGWVPHSHLSYFTKKADHPDTLEARFYIGHQVRSCDLSFIARHSQCDEKALFDELVARTPL